MPSGTLAVMFTYDFDYAWPLLWGHLIVAGSAGLLAVLAWRVLRRAGLALLLLAVAMWGGAGALAMHYAVQIASPQRLVTASFLPTGHGQVLELGAGSGRATIGLLQARPAARVTAVDLYRGYFGIDDNSPDRLRRNAALAGVGDRVEVIVADMRALPFEAGRFDAAFSVAAIDHLSWSDIDRSLREAARVLRPGGQLLVVSLHSDAWVKVAMPWTLHGGGFWGSTQHEARWRAALEATGFTVRETGTAPATRYVLATRNER